MAKRKVPIGAMVDRLFELREEMRAHEAKAKVVREEKTALELEIMGIMRDDQALEKITGHKATVTISRLIVPQAKDWKKVERFILANKALYLYERRISGQAFRELMDERGPKKPIPGIEPFEKVSLNLRAA